MSPKYISIVALLCGDANAISSALIQMDPGDGNVQTRANWQFIMDTHDGDVDAYLEKHTDPGTIQQLHGTEVKTWLGMFQDCINWGADLKKLRDTRGDAVFVAVASQPVLEDVELNLQIPILKKLLTAGFDINGRDARGRSALSYSTYTQRLALTRFLIEQGADLNDVYTSSFRTHNYPLNMAVQYFPAAIDLLVEHGASLELAFQSFAQRYSFGPCELREVKRLCALMLDPFADRRLNLERREAVRNIIMLQRNNVPGDVSSRIAFDVFRHSVEERTLQHWKGIVQTTLTAVDENTESYPYGDRKTECADILRDALHVLNQVQLF